MEITKHYNNLAERIVIDNEMVVQGYRMISDNFDVDYIIGMGEPHGIMTYSDEQSPPSPSIEPSHSTHISTLVAVDPVKARPAKVKRVWEGRNYFYDCFATQSVKDEYVAGKIKVGDYILVHFDDIGEQIVTAKVWKSW